MVKSHISFKILIILHCISSPSYAEKISLKKIDKYINELTTIKANFEQINSDGSIDKGMLYIRKPGKMRLEYEHPSNAMVIAGAGSVTIFDGKTQNDPIQFPLKHTPLKLLLNENVNLVENNMIIEHSVNGKNNHIVVQDPKKLSQGKIEIVFSSNPFDLLGWILTNQSNQKTTVRLSQLNKNINIPLYLFNINSVDKNKN